MGGIKCGSAGGAYRGRECNGSGGDCGDGWLLIVYGVVMLDMLVVGNGCDEVERGW